MKKIVLLLAMAAITVSSCRKIRDLLDFEVTVPYDKAEFVRGLKGDPDIPPEGARASLPTFAVSTDSKEFIEDNKTAVSLIRSVTLKEFNTKILLPLDQTFDLVDSVWVVVTAPGIDRRMIAYNYDVPNGAREISLTPTEEDLKDVFVQDSMYVSVEGFFRGKPSIDTKILFDLKLTVIANILEDD